MDNNKPTNTPITQSPLEMTPAQKLRARSLLADPALARHLPNISDSLKLPQLQNVDPQAISLQQVNTGVTVLIPGSPKMRSEDIIMFYWGSHDSFTTLHQYSGTLSIVRQLCICYMLIDQPEYGPLDLYYEVWRADHVIGTSPILKVVVESPCKMKV